MNEALLNLWRSTFSFHARFDGVGLSNPDAVEAMIREESAEVVKAFRHESNEHLADEVADLLVTCIGAMLARGMGVHDLFSAMYRVARKNDAKTWDTHHLKDGKIARRA